MSELAPMLRLDLWTLVAARRTILVYVALVGALSVLVGSVVALPLAAMVAVMVGTLLVRAPTDRIHLLYGTLPLRRRTVVVAHYAVTAATLVAGLLAVSLVTAAADAARGRPMTWLGASAVATLGAVLIALAVMLPATLVWGPRAASLVWFGGILLITSSVMLGGGLSAGLVGALTGTTGALVLVGAGLLAFAASLVVSIGIYERQDL